MLFEHLKVDDCLWLELAQEEQLEDDAFKDGVICVALHKK